MTAAVEARECFALFLAIKGGVTKVGEDGGYAHAGNALPADLAEMHVVLPRGPLSWVHPPEPDALTACREIDVAAAVRALRDPSPATGPMHF